MKCSSCSMIKNQFVVHFHLFILEQHTFLANIWSQINRRLMLVPLTVLLFHCYNTLFRCQPWASSTEFNQRIVRVNNLLKEGSAALPGVHIWHHRGFRSNLDFLCNDGVHLRYPGGVVVSSPMHKYWRSIRSAALHFSARLRSV